MTKIKSLIFFVVYACIFYTIMSLFMSYVMLENTTAPLIPLAFISASIATALILSTRKKVKNQDVQ